MATSLIVQQVNQLAKKLSIPESTELVGVLKATAFKGQVSDAQFSALLIVATQYGLNPWTREIYAFPDKNNGIVPVVGVDGWARIVNEHPQFDGMEFRQDDDSCTCIIFRKDRSHPIQVTEYMSECKRNTQPWQSHPKRMLRHKALIQGARLAFGFGGIFDQDEAEVIVEKDVTPYKTELEEAKPAEKPTLPYCTDANFSKNEAAWKEAITSGKKTPAGLIAQLQTRYLLTEAQKQTIEAWDRQPEVIEADFTEVPSTSDDFLNDYESAEEREVA